MKSSIIKNQIISNDFYATFYNPKHQSDSCEKSLDTSQKNPFQSTQKKSSGIKQTKQLLSQRLKEVTPFQQIHQNRHRRMIANDAIQKIRFQDNNLEIHFNPISKLVNQPFVRSKTCQQMRKQFSLKKQRKRNSSASKYSTPNTDLSQKKIQSTGMNSSNLYFNQNTSNKKSNQKINMRKHNASKIETNQFRLDPFTDNGNMIETFNKERIEKLSSHDPHQNKMKNKLTLGIKKAKHTNQIVDLPTQINFPFRINTIATKRQEHETQSPLFLQASFKHIEENFTPRLERYPLSGQLSSQRKQGQKRSSNNIESIELSQQNKGQKFHRYPIRTLQESPEHQEERNHINQDTSYDYSSQSPYNVSEYMHHPSSSLGYSAQQIGFHNELMANLHMTNTILQEKLKLKQQEIQELNKNYSQLKTELIQVKSTQQKKKSNIEDKKSYQTLQRDFNAFKSKPPSHKPPHYLTNFDLEIVHSIDTTENNSSEVLYNNSQENNSSLPSPRFCEGIEEEFTRQRQIRAQQKKEQHGLHHKINPSHQVINNPARLSKFYKKEELFQSNLSQQVSQQLDSQEIYYTNKYQPLQQIKYTFKKSHFYESQVRSYSNNQNKRDSLVYTLNEDLSINQSVIRQISPSFLNSSQKKYSSHLPTQEMLLQSVTERQNLRMHSSSQDDRISQLSPIKSNEQQKTDIGYYRYMKYRNPPLKTEKVILDESFNKFDYYLTPQKDSSQSDEYKDIKLQQEGLFQKAFTSLKKTKNQNSIDNTFPISNPLQRTQQNFIDSIIEQNSQSRYKFSNTQI